MQPQIIVANIPYQLKQQLTAIINSLPELEQIDLMTSMQDYLEAIEYDPELTQTYIESLLYVYRD